LKLTNFKNFQESTTSDWQLIARVHNKDKRNLVGKFVEQLKLLENDFGGFPVCRLEHCLQTATRAQRAGEDDEYVAVALLHDIGDTLSPANHGEVVGAMLKQYISEENYFLLVNHTDFQGYYYYHQIGKPRNKRDQFKDSPHYNHTERFCRLYDSQSFDDSYESEPLEFFIPYLDKLLN